MIILNRSIIKGLNPSYVELLDASLAAGETVPTPKQQSNHSGFIYREQDNGNWYEYDGLWIFANDGSKEFGYRNWIDTTALGSAGTSSWNSNQGWSSDGSTGRLAKTMTLSKYTQNNASYGFYFHTGANTTGVNRGLGGFEDRSISYRRASGNVLVFRLNSLNSTNNSIPDQVSNNSMYGVKRTNSSQIHLQANGVTGLTISDTSQTIVSTIFNIGYMGFYALSTWKYAMSWVGSGNVDQLKLYNNFNTYLANPSL